jgi:hypothetical protein
MNITALTTSSFYFTNSWARFAGAGYFRWVKHKDERHERT